MDTKIIVSTLLLIVSLCNYGQTKPDSLKGTYVGNYWFKWNEDTAWTIKNDTAYVISIDTSNCIINDFYKILYLPSGGEYETSYSFCNKNLPNWYKRFFSDDSLMVIFNEVSMPPPNYHVWSARFFGKKISSEILVGISDNISYDLKLELFPNPFNNFITIKNIRKNCMLRIIDLTGKVIFKQEIKSQNALQINTDQILKGLYILQITTSNAITTFKIMKN